LVLPTTKKILLTFDEQSLKQGGPLLFLSLPIPDRSLKPTFLLLLQISPQNIGIPFQSSIQEEDQLEIAHA